MNKDDLTQMPSQTEAGHFMRLLLYPSIFLSPTLRGSRQPRHKTLQNTRTALRTA
jgi:hypothetical protein